MHCLEGSRLFKTQSVALQDAGLDQQPALHGHRFGFHWRRRWCPTRTTPTADYPEEPHTLLPDGSAGSFATCLCFFGIDTFFEWLEDVQRSEAPAILDEQAWRDIQIPDDHVGKGPDTVCYGKSVSVWPSASLMRMEKRFCNNRADYDTQINIIYPTIVCPTCSSRHPDGVVTCIECSTRLEPHTDQSMITEYMRERE